MNLKSVQIVFAALLSYAAVAQDEDSITKKKFRMRF